MCADSVPDSVTVPDFVSRLASILTDEEVDRIRSLRSSLRNDTGTPGHTPPEVPDAATSPTPSPSAPEITGSLARIIAPDSGYLAHAYSTIDPWNSNHTGLLLEHSNGRIGLHYPDGRFYMILPDVAADSHSRWSRRDPNLFYYNHNGNELHIYDVHDNSHRMIRRFDATDSIQIGGGEGDISIDGDYLPVLSIRNGKKWAWLYRISTDTASEPYSTDALNACYVSADNRLVITGPSGVFVADGGQLRSVAYKQGHMDVGMDGTTPIIVWIDDRTNVITKIRLSDGRPTPILDLGWSPLGGTFSMACHISCPKSSDFCIVSTYGRDTTAKYANQILRVPFNGTNPTILATHHSDVIRYMTYSGQPHAVGSGKQFLFDSLENGLQVVYIGKMA